MSCERYVCVLPLAMLFRFPRTGKNRKGASVASVFLLDASNGVCVLPLATPFRFPRTEENVARALQWRLSPSTEKKIRKGASVASVLCNVDSTDVTCDALGCVPGGTCEVDRNGNHFCLWGEPPSLWVVLTYRTAPMPTPQTLPVAIAPLESPASPSLQQPQWDGVASLIVESTRLTCRTAPMPTPQTLPLASAPLEPPASPSLQQPPVGRCRLLLSRLKIGSHAALHPCPPLRLSLWRVPHWSHLQVLPFSNRQWDGVASLICPTGATCKSFPSATASETVALPYCACPEGSGITPTECVAGETTSLMRTLLTPFSPLPILSSAYSLHFSSLYAAFSPLLSLPALSSPDSLLSPTRSTLCFTFLALPTCLNG
ncbi:unnamed protein product [Closterium sp. Naga37s-1]|nr:unnamed protein product [Closterium sp. Naga37s-1]